jgi:hypothetical protein
MRIRIRVPWGAYKVGQEFDWGDGFARELIKRGRVEEVKPPPSPLESATVEQEFETAALAAESVLPKRRKKK